MASKKSAKKSSNNTFGAKADFIRDQPSNMSAKDIVDAAAKQGLRISVNHVYNLRAAAKKQPGAGRSSATSSKSGRGRTATGVGAAAPGLEAQLRSAIAQVGLRRAREIFDSVEKAFRGG